MMITRGLFICLVAAMAMMPAIGVHAAPPEKTILILFNHGTSRDNDCRQWFRTWPYQTPLWAEKIHGRELATSDGTAYEVKVEFVCTNRSPERARSDREACDLSVCRRVQAISEVIEDRAKTYPRRQIFLAGHSAGAWSSLLIKRHTPSAVNGLILTAPAFGGKRNERTCVAKTCTEEERPALRRMLIRAHQDAHMAAAAGNRSLNSLIATFPCDRFGWPSELSVGPAQGSRVHVFPPFEAGGQALACKVRGPDRFYNGKPLRFCNKVENRDIPGKPLCSEKRIAYCPAKFGKLCEERSHRFYNDYVEGLSYTQLDSPVFSDWFLGDGVVTDFIRESLDGWAHGDGKAIEGDACGFMKSLEMCKVR